MSDTNVIEYDFLGHSEFVSVGANFLKIDDSASDEVLASVATKIHVVEGALMWMIGDFLCELERLRSKDRLFEFLKQWGVSERSAKDAKNVCEIFPVADRLAELSFSHHQVAYYECTDHDDRLSWLMEAHPSRQNLSVANLRAAIRRSHHQKMTPKGGGVTVRDHKPAQDFVSYASRHDPSELDEMDRQILKEAASEMIEWWRKVSES